MESLGKGWSRYVSIPMEISGHYMKLQSQEFHSACNSSALGSTEKAHGQDKSAISLCIWWNTRGPHLRNYVVGRLDVNQQKASHALFHLVVVGNDFHAAPFLQRFLLKSSAHHDPALGVCC